MYFFTGTKVLPVRILIAGGQNLLCFYHLEIPAMSL